MGLLKPNIDKLEARHEVDALVAAASHRDQAVRVKAVYALGRLKAPSSVPFLARMAKQGDCPYQALQALQEIGTKDAAIALCDILRTASDLDFLEAIAEALGDLGFQPGEEDLPRFLALLHKGDECVALGVPGIAALLGFGQMVERNKSGNKRIKAYVPVVESIRNARDPRAIDLLVEVARSQREHDPCWLSDIAVDALGNIGDPRAVEPLLDLFNNSFARKDAVIGALGNLRAPQVIELLSNDQSLGIRIGLAASLRILAQIGTSEAMHLFFRKIASAYDDSQLLGILDIVSNPEAIPAFVAVLRGEAKGDLALAVKCLARLGWRPEADFAGVAFYLTLGKPEKCAEFGDPAIDALADMLADEDELKAKYGYRYPDTWRFNALLALGAIGGERAIGALVEALRALKSYDIISRLLSSELFDDAKKKAVFDDPAVLAILIDATEKGEKHVRARSAETLVSLYRSGFVGEAAKRSILSVKGRITEKHVDDPNSGHGDNGGSPSCHSDWSTHADAGIGLDFPGD